MQEPEEEPEYEVERILHQKVFETEDGTRELRYLIKWVGYSDEECTYEPKKNFNTPSILKDWQIAWKNGDTLDQFEVESIEAQMAAFSSRDQGPEESDPDSDIVMVEPDEPPKKKAKLKVPDALLTRKQLPKKKGIARPAPSRSSSPPRRPKPNATVSGHRSPLTELTKPKATAAPPLHRPDPNGGRSVVTKTKPPQVAATGFNKTSEPLRGAGSGVRPMVPRPVALAETKVVEADASKPEPQQFFAPDLSQRTRKTPADAPRVRRKSTGKPFRNLQHQNNARKLALAPPAPLSLPSWKDTVASEAASMDPTPTEPLPSEPVSPEHHASSLFFYSSDEDDQMRQDASPKIVAGTSQAITNEKPLGDKTETGNNVSRKPESATSKSDAALSTSNQSHGRSQLASPVAGNAGANASDELQVERQMQEENQDTSSDRNKDVRKPPSRMLDSATKASTDHANEKSIRRSASPDHILESTPAQRPRRNSLFNRSLPPEIAQPTRTIESRQLDPRRPESTIRDSPLIARPPLRAIQASKNTTIPKSLQTPIHGHERIKEIKIDGISRDIMSDNLVVHLALQGRAIGPTKLLYLDYAHRKLLIDAEPHYKVVLNFDRVLTRAEYDQVCSEQDPNSFITLGALEPWPDTETKLVPLAEYLEQHSIAALWEHPRDECMLLLYSCNAPTWRSFGKKPPRPASPYGPRLHILIRHRFQELGLESLASTLPQMSPTIGPSPFQPRASTTTYSSAVNTSQARDRKPPTSRRSSVASPDDTEPQRPGSIVQDPFEGVQRPQNAGKRTSVSLVDDAMDIEPNSIQPPISHKLSEAYARPSKPVTTDGAMDVDVPQHPRRTSRSPSPMQTDHPQVVDPITVVAFLGLSHTLIDLAYHRGRKIPSDPKSVTVILAYREVDPLRTHEKLIQEKRIHEIRNWLMSMGLPWNHILDKTVSGDWKNFMKSLEESTGVILFDRWFPVNTLYDVSKSLYEHEKLVCWKFDYRAQSSEPLPPRKMFPQGIALTICEACFVNEPQKVLDILKWLKYHHILHARSSSALLMLPPAIKRVLLEQAGLAQKRETTRLFIDIASLIEDFDAAFTTSIVDGSDSGIGSPGDFETKKFSLINTGWAEVYKDIQQTGSLSTVEQREMDNSKEELLFLYFSAWAVRHLEHYRRFVGIRYSNSRLKDANHVRFMNARDFIRTAVKSGQDKERATAEGRTQDRARSRTRPEDRDAQQQRSRSRGDADDRHRDRSRSRGRAALTPGQSPAYGA